MGETGTGTDKKGFAVNRVSLLQMRPGQKGKIVEISGGYGLARKLEALGIRTGKEITKISEQLMRGPVLLQQGRTQAAVGFGMASRVLVEVNAEDEK
ncbi:MAG TPA: ferrous iron transport protein A [Planctomycetes bacterium]|nr:ferrous iron transport protein A [Planctomycetota bacterium]